MPRAKKKRKRWSWDLESTNWDQPLCAAAVSDAGDVETYWGGDCLERIADLMEREGGTWLAHYGGGYDVPLLMNTARPTLNKLILTGSNILCAEGSNALRLRDTYPLTLSSLAKLAKHVGDEKGDLDRGRLEQYSSSEILDYNVRDCRILDAAVNAAHEYMDEQGAKRSWTAGGAAISLLRSLEPGTWEALGRLAIHAVDVREALPGTRGGRVECWARGEVPLVYSYDFKSSYPSRYADRPVGIGIEPAYFQNTTAELGEREAGVWWCRWYWPHRERIPPALDAETGAGAGYCSNYLIDDEIRLFNDRGIEVERQHGWQPQEMISLGSLFVRELYAQKEAGVPWAKVFLNSLHGKFSEDPLKDSWTKTHPRRWHEAVEPQLFGDWWTYQDLVVDRDTGLASRHCQPLAGAQILGRARCGLYEAIDAFQTAGWPVYYCDTDSVHTSCPPDQTPMQLGGKLGQLEQEAGPCRGIYLGPKSYLLIGDDGPEKSAMKGVPLRALRHGTTTIIEGETVFTEADPKKPATDLREAFFRAALKDGARCLKEGISSFVTGLKGHDGHWKRQQMVRTVRPTGRGKEFHPDRPDAWRYLTPREC